MRYLRGSWKRSNARGNLLAGKGEVFVRPRDVRDQGQVGEAMREVRRQFGEIDILVNNAGTKPWVRLDTMTPADYREALSIFFWAPLYTTLAVLPSMRQRRHGKIVNICSIGAKLRCLTCSLIAQANWHSRAGRTACVPR